MKAMKDRKKFTCRYVLETENNARSDWKQQFSDAITKGFIPENDVIDVENDFDKKDWSW
jgi:uncharacterized protein (DUF4213/DUF364 family)